MDKKGLLSEVQHKTGTQRLNIQCIADNIMHTTEDEAIKAMAQKIKDEMDTLTKNLRSTNY